MNFAALARWAMAAAGSLLPALGSCQASLTPQLLVAPNGMFLPANTASVVQAYFYGVPVFNNLGTDPDITDVTVSGSTVTARVHTTCGANCEAPTYAMHALQLPALAVGHYTLDLRNDDGSAIGQFPFDAGGPAPAPPPAQMYTKPQQLIAGRTSHGAVFFPLAAAGLQAGPATVAGRTISVDVYYGCGFLCPPGANFYGPAFFDLPALTPGVYTLQFTYVQSFPTARVPVGQFALNVQEVAAIPALGRCGRALLMLFLSLIAIVFFQRSPNHRGIFHG